MRVNEHIDAISLASGEADEARRLKLNLAAVLAAMRALVTGHTNLTWVTAGYGWLTLVVPILVAAPLYFAGSISFGGLMMAAGAFTQVQSSLRWFVDNFSTIADWRATLLRVASFRRAMLVADALHDVAGRIAFEEGAPGQMTMENLEIASPAGCTMLEERRVDVKAGEHVLIVGEPGAGKTLLFRALAGLWPWGEGRIGRPKGAAVFYMPRRPYLPPGTLGEVLAYPHGVEKFSARAFADALDRVGLQRLTPMLEQSRRWDRELNWEEQQSLMFARLLIHATALGSHRRSPRFDRRGHPDASTRYLLHGSQGHRRHPHRPRQCKRPYVQALPASHQGSHGTPAGASTARCHAGPGSWNAGRNELVMSHRWQ